MGYFLPYQERWIKDDSPLKLYEKSRRAGITYATSYRCIQKCLREKQGSSFVQWVTSRDELTAKEFVTDYVAMWAKKANAIAKEISLGLDGTNVEVVDEKHGITALVVKFKNGSRIVSLSSNPLAFAGKGGDILIDEMDLHDDQAALYAMAYPCITWGGQLEIVSAYSAKGTDQTEFARLCRLAKDDNPMGMSFHRTTLLDAVAEGFVEKVNEVKLAKGRPTQTREAFIASIRKGCLTIDAWNSQYLCIPNQANGEALIAAPDLAAALKPFEILRLELKGDGGELDVIDPSCEPYTHAEYWAKRLDQKRRHALGWDIARTGDLGSIWANRDDGEKSYTLASLITLKTCKFESQRRIMEALFDGLPLAVGCGDKTGLGMSSCETLEQEYPGRFAGCNFSALKITLGTTMQSVFEQRRQSIPIDRPEIRLDLAGIKKTSTPGGRLTFTEAGNELLPDSHNDLAWSCALAHYAGETLEDFGPCFAAAARAPEPPPPLSAAATDEWGGLGVRQNRRQGNW